MAEMAQATTARLAARIAAAKADLRDVETVGCVRTLTPEDARWAKSRDETLVCAAAHKADAERLEHEVTVAEALHRSWRDRWRVLVPGHAKARRARAAAIVAMHKEIAFHTQNADSYTSASAMFEKSRTKAIAGHAASEDKAHDDDLTRRRRYIADLEAGVVMIGQDPVLAVQARTNLLATLAEWRARVEAAETVVGFEPP